MTWQPGRPVRLETERFVVRSVTRDDVGRQYLAWAKDPEVMLTLNLPPRQLTRLQLVRYVERFNNKTAFHLGIFLKEEDGAQIGFYSVYYDAANRLGQTNVVVGERDWWGRGVVMETRAAIIDFLFDVLGAEKVWGLPLARNIPSVFNYKAQGFKCEGILRQHRRAVGGGRADQLAFGLLRDEWRAFRKGEAT